MLEPAGAAPVTGRARGWCLAAAAQRITLVVWARRTLAGKAQRGRPGTRTGGRPKRAGRKRRNSTQATRPSPGRQKRAGQPAQQHAQTQLGIGPGGVRRQACITAPLSGGPGSQPTGAARQEGRTGRHCGHAQRSRAAAPHRRAASAGATRLLQRGPVGPPRAACFTGLLRPTAMPVIRQRLEARLRQPPLVGDWRLHKNRPVAKTVRA